MATLKKNYIVLKGPILPLQEEVYAATTRPLVDAVLRGYNATVFAYGATGAGKTHTMVGPGGGEAGEDDPRQQGVMVRALNELFGQAAHLGDKVLPRCLLSAGWLAAVMT